MASLSIESFLTTRHNPVIADESVFVLVSLEFPTAQQAKIIKG